MEREILFRGKRIDNGGWIEGSLLITKFNTYIIPMYDESIVYQKPISVDSETVGQFTGLKDKNGKKIFDGDKIRGISNNPFSMGQCREYAVIWGIDHWHIEYTHFTLQELFNYCNNNIEVIGNIHNNHELRK